MDLIAPMPQAKETQVHGQPSPWGGGFKHGRVTIRGCKLGRWMSPHLRSMKKGATRLPCLFFRVSVGDEILPSCNKP